MLPGLGVGTGLLPALGVGVALGVGRLAVSGLGREFHRGRSHVHRLAAPVLAAPVLSAPVLSASGLGANRISANRIRRGRPSADGLVVGRLNAVVLRVGGPSASVLGIGRPNAARLSAYLGGGRIAEIGDGIRLDARARDVRLGRRSGRAG